MKRTLQAPGTPRPGLLGCIQTHVGPFLIATAPVSANHQGLTDKNPKFLPDAVWYFDTVRTGNVVSHCVLMAD
jgi:hypothetical protein